jgi:FixJ family two-component response regulator
MFRTGLLAHVFGQLTEQRSEQPWEFVQSCWDLKMAKILIVDDSAFTRNTLMMFFESGGHEVVKSGEVVLKEIIQYDPSAKVIMLSGSGDNALEERALQTGAKFFVEKPCAKREILDVIDQVMEI